MSLIQAISVELKNIWNEINNKILQEFRVFCTINRFKCHALSLNDINNDISNNITDVINDIDIDISK